MKKKYISLITVLLIIANFIGCQKKTVDELPPCISDVLSSYGITKTNILTLGDYSELHYRINEPMISDGDVEQYISQILESYAEIIGVNDRAVVEKGDVVFVDYVVYSEGKIVKYIESDILKVGAGKYNVPFEEALIGATVGESFSVELPTNQDKKQMTLYNITVKSINVYEKCTLDETFVFNHFGLNSIDEFYEYCYEQLRQQRLSDLKHDMEDLLFKNLIAICSFEIDKNEIANYSITYVKSYESIAEIYNMDLEEYAQSQMGMTMDAFYDYCYSIGEFEIKKYLLVGAIANDLNYGVSSEEYEARLTQLGESNSDKSYVEYLVLKEKVINYFFG